MNEGILEAKLCREKYWGEMDDKEKIVRLAGAIINANRKSKNGDWRLSVLVKKSVKN
jgi:hypothetical protein